MTCSGTEMLLKKPPGKKAKGKTNPDQECHRPTSQGTHTCHWCPMGDGSVLRGGACVPPSNSQSNMSHDAHVGCSGSLPQQGHVSGLTRVFFPEVVGAVSCVWSLYPTLELDSVMK